MAAGATGAWRTMDFVTPVVLPVDDYWIGIHLGDESTGIRVYGTSSGGDGYDYASDLYADGTSETFGEGAANTRLYCIYATYTLTSTFNGLTVRHAAVS